MGDDDRSGDNWPSAYTEGDLLVLRGSAFGSCLWELVATAQGYEPEPWPENMLRAFQEGHDGEQAVLDRLTGLGWVLEPDFTQSEHELACGPGVVLRFHPDAGGFPALVPNIWHLVEVKRLHQSTFRKIRRHGQAALGSSYLWQVSSMMTKLGAPCVVVIENKGGTPDPETGEREPADDDGELEFVWINEPPFNRAEIVKRARQVLKLTKGEDLPATEEPCEQPDQWPCRFSAIRPEPPKEIGTAVPPADQDEFETLCAAFDTSAERERQHRKTKDKAKAGLQGLFWEDIQRLHSETWVSWLQPTGSVTTLDEDRLAKDMAEVGLNLADYQTTKPKNPSLKVERR